MAIAKDDLGARIAPSRPSREQAEDAVRTLLRWAGDDPDREGLVETPARVARAYAEWFGGYDMDPAAYLSKTFEEVDGYDEMVILRNVRFESHCEHHIAPIIGISKLARLVEAYARRLQVQERLTAQIANTLNDVLQPGGVGVVIEASHGCMSTRGVNRAGLTMVTSQMIGAFRDNAATRREFLAAIGNPTSGSAMGG